MAILTLTSSIPCTALPVAAGTSSSLPSASTALLPLLSQKRDQHGRHAFRDTAAEDTVSLTTNGLGLASLLNTLQNMEQSHAHKC